MGCKEMKEKKKEPKIKSEQENKEENPEDKNEQKPLDEEKNIAEIEQNNSKIKQEDKDSLFSNKDQDIKEDEKIESLIKIDKDPYIPDYLGKLCFQPLELFIYDIKKRTMHLQKYKIEDNPDLENLTSTSSCCNGDNKLFISNGVINDSEIVDKLWIFDLINYEVECIPNFPCKINHSMIYVPPKYLFLVGGNDMKVFCFDIKEKRVMSWGNLNKKRIEPALIQMNNYLYVFDNINKNENSIDLSFEKTDLLSDKPNFELIRPNLDENIKGNIIPKFFGVAKESEDNIIFLGGNILDEQNEDINDIKNYRYNIKENKIEFSEVPFVNVQLKEKTFLNYNNKDNIYFILSDFHSKCPQVVFYIKSKNRLKVVNYEPDIFSTLKEKEKERQEKNNILLRGIKANQKNKIYNFNMPKNNENVSDNIINNN